MDIGRGNLRRPRRAPLGCAREREQRARERAESEGERRGAAGRLRGTSGGVGVVRLKQEVAAFARARSTLPLCLLAGGGRRLCPRWAGPLQWWAGPSGGYTGEAS